METIIIILLIIVLFSFTTISFRGGYHPTKGPENKIPPGLRKTPKLPKRRSGND